MDKKQKNTLINTIMNFHSTINDLDEIIDNVYDEYGEDKKLCDCLKSIQTDSFRQINDIERMFDFDFYDEYENRLRNGVKDGYGDDYVEEHYPYGYKIHTKPKYEKKYQKLVYWNEIDGLQYDLDEGLIDDDQKVEEVKDRIQLLKDLISEIGRGG